MKGSQVDGQGCATLGYGVCLMLIALAFISRNDPDHRVRVCKDREGLQVAERVPGGKRRYSKSVVTLSGDLIPYGEWVNSCKAVYPPGGAPGE